MNQNHEPAAIANSERNNSLYSYRKRLIITLSALQFGLFFFVIGFTQKFIFFYGHGESANIILCSRTLYGLSSFNKTFPQYNLSTHIFPLYPAIQHVLSYTTLNNYWFFLPILTYFQSISTSFAFLSMHQKLRCTSEPLASAMMFLYFPFSSAMHRMLPFPDSLFLTFVLLAFKFYFDNKAIITTLICFLAILTKIDGILIPTSIIISGIMMKQFKFIMLPIFSYAALYILFIFDPFLIDYHNYVDFPLTCFIDLFSTKPIRFVFIMMPFLFIPALYGYFNLFSISTPISIFATLCLAYLICIKTEDLERDFSPLAVFSIYVGLDNIVITITRIVKTKVRCMIIASIFTIIFALILESDQTDQAMHYIIDIPFNKMYLS